MKKYFKALPIGNSLHDKKQVLQGLRKVIMNRNVPGFYKKLSAAGGGEAAGKMFMYLNGIWEG